MTWDVYALRAPRGARTVEDIPDGYEPPSLGRPEDVVAVVREVAPHVDATSEHWLVLQGEDHSIEVMLGKSVTVHDLSFYIRGGDGAVGVVLAVCRRLGATAYDTETGELLTTESRPPEPPPVEDGEDEGRPWWKKMVGGG